MNELKNEIDRLIRNVNSYLTWIKIKMAWKRSRDILINSVLLAIVGLIFMIPFIWWGFVVYILIHFVSKYW